MGKVFKNSIEKGSFRYIIFKEKRTWYGVALEFNQVVSAKTPENAMLDLFDSVAGYIQAVKKSKSRPFALNQTTTKEYLDMWNKLTGSNGDILSPKEFYSYGTRVLA